MSAARRPPRRRTRRGPTLVLALLVGLVAVGAGAVWAVVATLNRQVEIPVVATCRATVDGVGQSLSPEQTDNAALIALVAVRRGLPARAATIGLATALQESGLVNVDHGDRDSIGLFQQRPSQGWGTVEQILDPVYSTNTFYDHLVDVPGYTELPVTEAAQTVQRSGFPDAYAKHEPRARAFASALTGWSPAALTCTLPQAEAAGSSGAVLVRVARDLGELPSSADEGDDDSPARVTLDATALAPDDATRGAWAAAHWAVAVADGLALDEVAVADQVWTRRSGAWAAAETPLTGGSVVLTVARV